MNDLAEKALQGGAAARRYVAARPAGSLAVTGFVVAALVVVAGGVAADARPTRTLTSWLGLQSDHGLSAPAPGTLLLVALCVLVLVWLLAAEVVRRTAVPESRVWLVVAAWTTPFALGPPLLDTAVYGYAAFGFVQRAGDDPSVTAPASLAGDRLVDAIDPGVRNTVSAAGPLGSVLQHLSVPVGGGTALGAVVVLRVVGLLAAFVIARCAVELARGGDVTPSAALVLVGLNPLVLLYVVSSPHLDGPMLALVLTALVAVQRRRWPAAVVLAALAGSVSAQALVVVPVVITAHVARRRVGRARAAVRDAAVAVVVVVALGFAVPDGFGWVRAVSDQFSAHTPYSIPYATGRILAPIVAGASYDDLAVAGRLTSAAAGICVVAYLLVSARHRRPAATVGFALLAMALLAPNLYPWYLLWGLLCLASTAVGDRRRMVVALSAAGCVLLPPGLGPVAANVVTACALVVVGLVLAATVLRARSAAPGDLADSGAHVGEVDHRDDQ